MRINVNGREIDAEYYLKMVVAEYTISRPSLITPDHQLGEHCLEICKQIEQDMGVPVILSVSNGKRTKFSELLAAFFEGNERQRLASVNA